MTVRKNWRVSERLAVVVESLARRYRVSESWIVEAAFWRGIDAVEKELREKTVSASDAADNDDGVVGDEFFRRVLLDRRFDDYWSAEQF